MPKQLSAHERYLFSLTQSSAKTIAAQRAAIAREGLSGKTKSDIRKEQLKTWKEFREKPENSDLKRAPAWLIAARFNAFPGWRHVAPVVAGKPVDVSSIGKIAHGSVDFGRLRKHSRGAGTAFQPKVRESDNGKSGWNRVVFRYADYLCVVSPDKKTIAICAKQGEKISLHTIRNGAFMYGGERNYVNWRSEGVMTWPLTEETAKIMARALRKRLPMGLECATDGRNVLVTEKTTGEVYHFNRWSHAPFSVVREAFAKRAMLRRQEERNAQLDALLRDMPSLIWVEYSDSILSGNCESESKKFRDTLSAKIQADGELGAVRASVILAMRDDNYTRRACRAAALRYLRS